MPVLDGLDASKQIRAIESAGTGLGPEEAPIPIIALTANVFESDRRLCEEAGMNAFVAKPLEVAALLAAILAVTKTTSESSIDRQAQDAEAESPVNRETFLERCGGNEELVDQVLAMFAETMVDLVSAMEEAMQSGNLEEAERAAHELRGAASTVCCDIVAEAATVVEMAAHRESIDGATEAIRRLSGVVESTRRHLGPVV